MATPFYLADEKSSWLGWQLDPSAPRMRVRWKTVGREGWWKQKSVAWNHSESGVWWYSYIKCIAHTCEHKAYVHAGPHVKHWIYEPIAGTGVPAHMCPESDTLGIFVE